MRAVTAKMPMMMPSMVRKERILLAQMDLMALAMASLTLKRPSLLLVVSDVIFAVVDVRSVGQIGQLAIVVFR